MAEELYKPEVTESGQTIPTSTTPQEDKMPKSRTNPKPAEEEFNPADYSKPSANVAAPTITPQRPSDVPSINKLAPNDDFDPSNYTAKTKDINGNIVHKDNWEGFWNRPFMEVALNDQSTGESSNWLKAWATYQRGIEKALDNSVISMGITALTGVNLSKEFGKLQTLGETWEKKGLVKAGIIPEQGANLISDTDMNDPKYQTELLDKVSTGIGMVLGFVIDIPVFGAAAKIGVAGAQKVLKPLANRLTGKMIANLVDKGIPIGLAEQGVKAGTAKTGTILDQMYQAGKVGGQLVTGAAGGVTSLGGYNMLSNALSQITKDDRSLSEINYKDVLHEGVIGMEMGAGLGLLGTTGKYAEEILGRATTGNINKALLLGGTKAATLGSEVSWFALGDPYFRNRQITSKDWADAVGIVLAGKMAGLPFGFKESSVKSDHKQPVFNDLELEMLDKYRPQGYTGDIYDSFKNNNTVFHQVLTDPQIPYTLKWKLLEAKGNIYPYIINNMGSSFVDTRDNRSIAKVLDHEGNLLDAKEFTNGSEAEDFRFNIERELKYNSALSMFYDMTPAEKNRVKAQLLENGADVIQVARDIITKPEAIENDEKSSPAQIDKRLANIQTFADIIDQGEFHGVEGKVTAFKQERAAALEAKQKLIDEGKATTEQEKIRLAQLRQAAKETTDINPKPIQSVLGSSTNLAGESLPNWASIHKPSIPEESFNQLESIRNDLKQSEESLINQKEEKFSTEQINQFDRTLQNMKDQYDMVLGKFNSLGEKVKEGGEKAKADYADIRTRKNELKKALDSFTRFTEKLHKNELTPGEINDAKESIKQLRTHFKEALENAGYGADIIGKHFAATEAEGNPISSEAAFEKEIAARDQKKTDLQARLASGELYKEVGIDKETGKSGAYPKNIPASDVVAILNSVNIKVPAEILKEARREGLRYALRQKKFILPEDQVADNTVITNRKEADKAIADNKYSLDTHVNEAFGRVNGEIEPPEEDAKWRIGYKSYGNKEAFLHDLARFKNKDNLPHMIFPRKVDGGMSQGEVNEFIDRYPTDNANIHYFTPEELVGFKEPEELEGSIDLLGERAKKLNDIANQYPEDSPNRIEAQNVMVDKLAALEQKYGLKEIIDKAITTGSKITKEESDRVRGILTEYIDENKKDLSTLGSNKFLPYIMKKINNIRFGQQGWDDIKKIKDYLDNVIVSKVFRDEFRARQVYLDKINKTLSDESLLRPKRETGGKVRAKTNIIAGEKSADYIEYLRDIREITQLPPEEVTARLLEYHELSESRLNNPGNFFKGEIGETGLTEEEQNELNKWAFGDLESKNSSVLESLSGALDMVKDNQKILSNIFRDEYNKRRAADKKLAILLTNKGSKVLPELGWASPARVIFSFIHLFDPSLKSFGSYISRGRIRDEKAQYTVEPKEITDAEGNKTIDSYIVKGVDRKGNTIEERSFNDKASADSYRNEQQKSVKETGIPFQDQINRHFFSDLYRAEDGETLRTWYREQAEQKFFKNLYGVKTNSKMRSILTDASVTHIDDSPVTIMGKGTEIDKEGKNIPVTKKLPLTKLQALNHWLILQQEGLRDDYLKPREYNEYGNVVKGMGWTEESFKALDDWLEPELKKYGLWMRDQMAEIAPDVTDVYTRLNGIGLEMNENYWPISRDMTGKMPTTTTLEYKTDGFNPTSIDSRFHKVRVANDRPVQNADARDIFLQYMNDQTKYIYRAEAVKRLNSIFRDPDVAQSIKTNSSTWAYQGITDFIDRMSGRADIKRNKFVDWVTRNISRGILYAKTRVSFNQIAGITSYSMAVDPLHLNQYALRMLATPEGWELGKILTQHPFMVKRGIAAFNVDIDKQFLQYDKLRRSLTGTPQGIIGKTWERARYSMAQLNSKIPVEAVENILGANVTIADKLPILIGGGAYIFDMIRKDGKTWEGLMKEADELNKSTGMGEAASKVNILQPYLNEWENLSESTQQSTRMTNISPLRAHSPMLRLMAMFTSGTVQMARVGTTSLMDCYQNAKQGNWGNAAKNFRTFAIAWPLQGILYQWIQDNFRIDPKSLGIAMLEGPIEGYALMGRAFNYAHSFVMNELDQAEKSQIIPLFDSGFRMANYYNRWKSYKAEGKLKEANDAFWKMLGYAGNIMGVPIMSFVNIGEGIEKAKEPGATDIPLKILGLNADYEIGMHTKDLLRGDGSKQWKAYKVLLNIQKQTSLKGIMMHSQEIDAIYAKSEVELDQMLKDQEKAADEATKQLEKLNANYEKAQEALQKEKEQQVRKNKWK